MIDWLQWASAVGGIATAIGVFVAAGQVYLSRKLARSSFEDALVKEYRELTRGIPINALMGLPLDEKQQAESLDDFFRYFDLCNEQVFLYDNQKIGPDTWQMWSDGILSNMRRPAFVCAWRTVSHRAGAGTFTELRGFLEKHGISTEAPTVDSRISESPDPVADAREPSVREPTKM